MSSHRAQKTRCTVGFQSYGCGDNDRSENALITGANGGIGSALALKLAAAGTKLVLAGRNTPDLEQLALELNANAVTCDFTDSDEVGKCVTETLEELGSIEAAAHCIGSILLIPASFSSWYYYSHRKTLGSQANRSLSMAACLHSK